MEALHDILCNVVGMPFSDKKNHCYFNPPNNMQLNDPCIKYNYTNDFNIFADNIPYISFKRYTVTIIDEDPDSKIVDRLKKLPYCVFDRHYVSDGLHHFVFVLYYKGPRIKEVISNG